MNILVTGANGQLGRSIQKIVGEKPTQYNFIFTDVAGEGIVPLDITDAGAVMAMVKDNDVKAIINCAAYTNVDKAEDDAEFAEILNAKAVGNLANAAKSNDAVLFHVSTDYVFGGAQGNTPRSEDEPANPTGVYGVTKLHGEEAVKQAGCKHIIIRTAWLYSEYGKNFVKTMLNLTSTKPALKVVFDQVGTPTYAYDLAKAILDILASGSYEGKDGIYHYSNEGVCSWYDFTKMIQEIAYNRYDSPFKGQENACDIQPCHSCEFPSKVVRPSYSVLDKTKIKETFAVDVPYWTDSLKKCIINLSQL